MLSKLWSFIKRHKKKLIFTGVVVGGVVIVSKYARKRLQEYQLGEATECFANVRQKNHFDSNQRTCNITVMSMLPNLRDALRCKLDSEALTDLLRTKPANRLEIWEQLKVVSFTRSIVAVYSCCMLVVFVRIQLNILGGYMYRDSLNNRSSGSVQDYAVVATDIIQKQYLTQVQYLFEQGLDDLIRDVQCTVTDCLSGYSLKDKLCVRTIRKIVCIIRSHIEYQLSMPANSGDCSLYAVGVGEARGRAELTLSCGPSSLSRYVLPSVEAVGQACHLTEEERTLGLLNSETRDMIESSDFSTVLKTCLDTAFCRLVDRVSEQYEPAQRDDATTQSNDMVVMPLAKVIPIMNSLIYSVVSDSPNPFLQELLLKEQIKYFAANIYEAFCAPQDVI